MNRSASVLLIILLSAQMVRSSVPDFTQFPTKRRAIFRLSNQIVAPLFRKVPKPAKPAKLNVADHNAQGSQSMPYKSLFLGDLGDGVLYESPPSSPINKPKKGILNWFKKK